MPLTPAQYGPLKTHIAGNAATVQYAGSPTAISAVPNNDDGNEAIAAWYNLAAAPDYWVWRTSFTRTDVYNTTSPIPSTWDWATYKSQPVSEQNAWVQMFMGDTAPIGNLNFRAGVFAVFSGSAAQNNQRAHIFAVGRRKASNVEKLFAVVSTGGTTNTGNDLGQARGSSANPDTPGFEGMLTRQEVQLARDLG